MDLRITVVLFTLHLLVGARPSPAVKYVGLKQLGKYSGVNDDGIVYEKVYFVSSFMKMTPPAARSFCKSFGPNMDLVSFESRNEFLAVRSKFEPEVRDKSVLVIVGGFSHMTATKSEYHWISSGLKTFIDIEATNQEKCLGIRKVNSEPVAFVPVSCDEPLKFMCQEMDIQYAN